MTERLLQFIWQFQYYNNTGLVTAAGEPLQILQPGTLNRNQGPDFKNARVKVGNTVLAGAVELHLKTSHWYAHGHQGDKNYKGVVLHVVAQHDIPFATTIPVLELGNRIAGVLLQRYQFLMNSTAFIPCEKAASAVSQLTWNAWKERLLAERLQEKANTILARLAHSGHNWEETFWQLLARSFGLTVNTAAFEEIAQTLPTKMLARHRHNLLQLEALLLGQAGLLQNGCADDYAAALQREYAFLCTKWNLQKVHQPVLFLRMRPSNFPTVRLAQLAGLLHQRTHIFASILDANEISVVKCLFDVSASAYWQTHYQFGKATVPRAKKIGSATIETILINAVCPLVFAYGAFHNQEAHKEKAVRWMQALSPEKNNITLGFENIGVKNESAADSQALILLKNNYCTRKLCLQCAVGHGIFKKNAVEIT